MDSEQASNAGDAASVALHQVLARARPPPQVPPLAQTRIQDLEEMFEGYFDEPDMEDPVARDLAFREEVRETFAFHGLAASVGRSPSDMLVFARMRQGILKTAAWAPLLDERGKQVTLQTLAYEWFHVNRWSHTYRALRRQPVGNQFALFAASIGLPTPARTSGLYAFRNGLLDVGAMTFQTWAEYEHEEDKGACKHFDLVFDRAWLGASPPCADFERLLDTQSFKDGERTLLKALLGRLGWKNGERDTFQHMPIIYGTSGAGKTTICEAVLSAMYDPEVRGYLSGEVVTSFPLEVVKSSEVVLMNDISDSFVRVFSESLLKNMIEGAVVGINCKNMPLFYREWTPPLVATSNRPLSWGGGNSGMDRRVTYFECNYKPAQSDPQLAARLAQPEQQVWLLLDLARCYSAFIAAHGHKSIVDIKMELCPQTLALGEDLNETSPEQEFVSMCIEKSADPRAVIGYRPLAAELKKFSAARCMSQALQPRDLTEPLRDIGAQFVGKKRMRTHEYNTLPNTYHGAIFGATLKPYDMDQDDDVAGVATGAPPQPAQPIPVAQPAPGSIPSFFGGGSSFGFY